MVSTEHTALQLPTEEGIPKAYTYHIQSIRVGTGASGYLDLEE